MKRPKYLKTQDSWPCLFLFFFKHMETEDVREEEAKCITARQCLEDWRSVCVCVCGCPLRSVHRTRSWCSIFLFWVEAVSVQSHPLSSFNVQAWSSTLSQFPFMCLSHPRRHKHNVNLNKRSHICLWSWSAARQLLVLVYIEHCVDADS